MSKGSMAKRKLYIVLLACLTFLLGGVMFQGCGFANTKTKITANIEELVAENYIPLIDAMKLCGYKNTTKDEAKSTFAKKDSGVKISMEFLFDEDKCIKNEYQFDLKDEVVWSGEICFIKSDKFKEIVNIDVAYENEQLVIEPIEYGVHEWTTAFTPLIAHAGGGYRTAEKDSKYTNSLDAVIQNYDLGHRVFEIDFRLTSDRELAAIHTWKDENGENKKMTAAQWKEQDGVSGTPCRTMLIGDMLDQMAINKDMFLITDTKTAKVGENMEREFEIIKAEAMKRDPKLLERIIPQIYNREMYSVVTHIHPFQSIIFTLYKAPETDAEVLEFVIAHDDIKVVTTRGSKNGRFDLVKPLSEHEKLVYTHTLNKYEDIGVMVDKGVYGIYTDYLLPRDWKTYLEAVKN